MAERQAPAAAQGEQGERPRGQAPAAELCAAPIMRIAAIKTLPDGRARAEIIFCGRRGEGGGAQIFGVSGKQARKLKKIAAFLAANTKGGVSCKRAEAAAILKKRQNGGFWFVWAAAHRAPGEGRAAFSEYESAGRVFGIKITPYYGQEGIRARAAAARAAAAAEEEEENE